VTCEAGAGGETGAAVVAGTVASLALLLPLHPGRTLQKTIAQTQLRIRRISLRKGVADASLLFNFPLVYFLCICEAGLMRIAATTSYRHRKWSGADRLERLLLLVGKQSEVSMSRAMKLPKSKQ
jgi:hypothetical protein